MIDNVKIGPLVYKVVFDGNLTGEEGPPIFGAIVISKSTIFVEDLADDQWKRITLLHEIIHAMLDQAGQEQNENVINALAHGVYGLLKDNPDLIEWIGNDDHTIS